MKRFMFLALPLIIVVITLIACAAPTSAPTPTPATAPTPPKTLDIGISAPLTGTAAHHGTMMQNGIIMAIEDQNNEGGVTIAGQKYTINPVIRDNKWDIIVSKSVAEELIFDKGVKVIAGPFVMDAVSAQTVTEPNKVILFPLVPVVPSMTGPNKPYTFFTGFLFLQMYDTVVAYLPQAYPEAKKVVTMVVDLPDLPSFVDSAKATFPRYGLEWLGYEKFPATITDFMPVLSRVLAKNPDVIDVAQLGSLGGVGALEVKQIREAGFKGIILVPGSVLNETMEEVIPKEYLYKIICDQIDAQSPIGGEAYRSFSDRFQKRFNIAPNNLAYLEYNPVKALFQFLDGKDTMDSAAWMEGFAKYRWDGLFGFENYWVGKPLYGIDRFLLGPTLVQEYTDGKLEPKWVAPLPYDLVIEK
jgi:branched-chain amino acid transport system substrate-binding protein